MRWRDLWDFLPERVTWSVCLFPHLATRHYVHTRNDFAFATPFNRRFNPFSVSLLLWYTSNCLRCHISRFICHRACIPWFRRGSLCSLRNRLWLQLSDFCDVLSIKWALVWGREWNPENCFALMLGAQDDNFESHCRREGCTTQWCYTKVRVTPHKGA